MPRASKTETFRTATDVLPNFPPRTSGKPRTLPSTANARMMRKKWERRRPGDPILGAVVVGVNHRNWLAACLGGGIRCCANGWSYPRGRLAVVTQMRKECPLFCVLTYRKGLICSPGLPDQHRDAGKQGGGCVVADAELAASAPCSGE